MTVGVSHAPRHAASAAVAYELARLLRLPVHASDASAPDLFVAPASAPAADESIAVRLTANDRSTTPPSGAAILCGVRDEDDAPALAIAAAIADRLDVRLVIVHALGRTSSALAAVAHPGAPVTSPFDRDLAHQVARRASRAAGVARGGVVRVVSGPAGPGILAAAAEERPMLLVVSTSRHSWLRRVLRGSPQDALLRWSPCPVLVAPRGAAPALRLRQTLSSDDLRLP